MDQKNSKSIGTENSEKTKEPEIRELPQDPELDAIWEALSDLESLKKFYLEGLSRLPDIGERIPGSLFLYYPAIHILLISQLEHLLKRTRKIGERQSEIKNFIERSSLTEVEKERMLYLFLTRHIIVHNGGYPDEKFKEEVKKANFKHIRVDPERPTIRVIASGTVPKYIAIIKKLILKDITSEDNRPIVESMYKFRGEQLE